MRDYDLLKKYEVGRIIDTEDMNDLKRLEQIRFVHIGTHVEMNDEQETISLQPTAKSTECGMKIYNVVTESRTRGIPHPCNKCHDCVPAISSVEHEDVCWESRARVRSFWHRVRMVLLGCGGFRRI